MSITREQVLEMTSFTEVNKAIKDPATSGMMQRLLTDREVAVHVSKLMQARVKEQDEREAAVDTATARVSPPSTEELAAEAAAVAGTPTPEVPAAPVVPDTAAEDAEYKAHGIVTYRDAGGKITRLVQEYQVRDDEGNPIGRPTHLEAKNVLELSNKQRVAHEEAVRFGYRMKKHKTTFKQEPRTILTDEQVKAAAEQALEEKDPSKAEDVVRAAIETQYAKREAELKAKENREEGRAISNEFMRRHLHDYNPCDANQKEIGEYFVAHKLDFTLDNLEVCFADLMDENKLVKVERPFQRPVEGAANPAPTTATAPAATEGTPPVASPAAAPVSAAPQPAASTPPVEGTVTPSVAPNNPAPATRRPGVNGSLPPGSLSAQRPVPVDPSQARKEFMKKLNKMTSVEIRRERDTNPQFVKELATYGIKLQ